jgi:hypothetical protein
MNGQFRSEPTCPNDGSVCICSGGYHVTGQNEYGYNEVAKDPGSTACQTWKFKIGDIILVEKPSGTQKQYWQANMVARWTGSSIVHNAIVASVPPLGVTQNGKNIILIEAMKGDIKKVVQNTLQELVERYPFGAVHIRRVDPAKYPNFYTPQTQAAVKQWLSDRINESFDLAMVNPLKRAVLARARYVPIDPWCADKTWAIKMYQDGGPHMWICSELVAWTLAFPGGLNMNPANKDPWCKYPKWVIKNLQPNPGDFLTAKWVEQIPWKMPCEELGCFMAVPPVGAPLVASRVHTPAPTTTDAMAQQPYTTVPPQTTAPYTTMAPQNVIQTPQSIPSYTTMEPSPCDIVDR